MNVLDTLMASPLNDVERDTEALAFHAAAITLLCELVAQHTDTRMPSSTTILALQVGGNYVTLVKELGEVHATKPEA